MYSPSILEEYEQNKKNKIERQIGKIGWLSQSMKYVKKMEEEGEIRMPDEIK